MLLNSLWSNMFSCVLNIYFLGVPHFASTTVVFLAPSHLRGQDFPVAFQVWWTQSWTKCVCVCFLFSRISLWMCVRKSSYRPWGLNVLSTTHWQPKSKSFRSDPTHWLIINFKNHVISPDTRSLIMILHSFSFFCVVGGEPGEGAGAGPGRRSPWGPGGGGAASPGGGAEGRGAGGAVSPHPEGPLEPGPGQSGANALQLGAHADALAGRTAGGESREGRRGGGFTIQGWMGAIVGKYLGNLCLSNSIQIMVVMVNNLATWMQRIVIVYFLSFLSDQRPGDSREVTPHHVTHEWICCFCSIGGPLK